MRTAKINFLDKLAAEAFEAGIRLMDNQLAALRACIEGEAK
jgi:hypothetical protein